MIEGAASRQRNSARHPFCVIVAQDFAAAAEIRIEVAGRRVRAGRHLAVTAFCYAAVARRSAFEVPNLIVKALNCSVEVPNCSVVDRNCFVEVLIFIVTVLIFIVEVLICFDRVPNCSVEVLSLNDEVRNCSVEAQSLNDEVPNCSVRVIFDYACL